MKKYAVIDFSRTSLSLLVANEEISRLEIVFKTYRPILIGDLVNKKERLTEKGINKIISEALELIDSARSLEADEIYGISTTLLRNIQNSEEVMNAIKEKTGLSVTSLSGKEEAYAAWYANENYKVLKKAVLFDIGGTSTEICDFAHPYESDMISLDFGTSTIRSAFVKDVYPTKAEEEEIKAFVKGVLKEQVEKHELENAVLSGSNMNALYTIYQDYYDVPQSHERLMQYKKLKKLIKVLMNDKKRNSLIIKNVPEKTHLIVPSAICLKVMLKYFNIGNITVSSYGVKEGYLKLIKKGAVKAEPLTVAKRG